jgi:hypothetical protein
MKKSELKSLIREVILESKSSNVMDSLKSDMANSSFHADYLDNAAKLIHLAGVQLKWADYAMSDLGPDGVEIDVDPNEPAVTRKSVQAMYRQLESLLKSPLFLDRK